MINAKELRIGNLVMPYAGHEIFAGRKSDPVVVTGRLLSLIIDAEGDCEINNYDPIYLTPDWLEKFSVESYREDKGYSGTCFFLHKGNLPSNISQCWVKPNGIGEFLFYYGGFVNGVKVEYVHQVQNLYFDLTGEELKIKEAQQP